MIFCNRCRMHFRFDPSATGERTACAIEKCTRRFHHTSMSNNPALAKVWMNNEDIDFTYLIAKERRAMGKYVDNGGCHE